MLLLPTTVKRLYIFSRSMNVNNENAPAVMNVFCAREDYMTLIWRETIKISDILRCHFNDPYYPRTRWKNSSHLVCSFFREKGIKINRKSLNSSYEPLPLHVCILRTGHSKERNWYEHNNECLEGWCFIFFDVEICRYLQILMNQDFHVVSFMKSIFSVAFPCVDMYS